MRNPAPIRGKRRWFGVQLVFKRTDPTAFSRKTMDQIFKPEPASQQSRLAEGRFHIPGGAIMTTRKGWAVWKGGIKDGDGTISTETGVLDEAPYGFKSRFENGKGTNPEELIAAAHAACFSMALSLMLGESGMTPERIETHAEVTIEKVGDGFDIISSHLNVVVKIRLGHKGRIEEIANKAKAGCPVSKLMNAKITMEARLE